MALKIIIDYILFRLFVLTDGLILLKTSSIDGYIIIIESWIA